MKYSSSCRSPYLLLIASSAATNTAAITQTSAGTRSVAGTGAGAASGPAARTERGAVYCGDGGEPSARVAQRAGVAMLMFIGPDFPSGPAGEDFLAPERGPAGERQDDVDDGQDAGGDAKGGQVEGDRPDLGQDIERYRRQHDEDARLLRRPDVTGPGRDEHAVLDGQDRRQRHE